MARNALGKGQADLHTVVRVGCRRGRAVLDSLSMAFPEAQ